MRIRPSTKEKFEKLRAFYRYSQSDFFDALVAGIDGRFPELILLHPIDVVVSGIRINAILAYAVSRYRLSHTDKGPFGA